MIWLTWRQFRTQLVVVYLLVAAACVWLAATGPALARLAHRNKDFYDLLTGTDHFLYESGIVLLAVAPALLGIFWGAPLVARELENGTYRLAWNQSVTRSRWLAAKLGFAVLATVLAVAILSVAVTWWAHPIDGAQGDQRGSLPSRMTPVAFAMRGVVPVGYAVLALCLGTLVGLVVRRSIAAMALTLALYVFIQIAVPLWVRPHLVTPVRDDVVISETTLDGITSDGGGPFVITAHTDDPQNWILTDRTVDRHGAAAKLPSWFQACLPPVPADDHGGGTTQVNQGPGTLDDCFTRLTAEGYRQELVYQPVAHFWRLQWTELGLYLAASGLLTAASFWWVRRRLS